MDAAARSWSDYLLCSRSTTLIYVSAAPSSWGQQLRLGVTGLNSVISVVYNLGQVFVLVVRRPMVKI